MSYRSPLFLRLSPAEQLAVLRESPPSERLARIRTLPLDDAADLIQAAPAAQRDGLLALLEDDEAIRYLRIQGREVAQPISAAYVLDSEQRLLGIVSPLDLFSSPDNRTVDSLMTTDSITVAEDADQELVSQIFRENDLLAAPVIDSRGRMKGVVTVDDIVDVLAEEATEDVQKIGGAGALDAPYLRTRFFSMMRSRGGWLTLLWRPHWSPASLRFAGLERSNAWRTRCVCSMRRASRCSQWPAPRRRSSTSSTLMAALLGMLTGIGGGVVRDLLLAQIPTVLRSDLYAVAALAGATIVVLGDRFAVSPLAASIAGAALCFALRLAAIHRGWHLPKPLHEAMESKNLDERKDPDA